MNGPRGSITTTKGCNASLDKQTLGNLVRKTRRRQKGENGISPRKTQCHGRGHYDGRKMRTMHEKRLCFKCEKKGHLGKDCPPEEDKKKAPVASFHRER